MVPLIVQVFTANKNPAQANGSQSGKDTTKRPGTAKMELHAQGVAEARHNVDNSVLLKMQNVTDVTRRATSVLSVELNM